MADKAPEENGQMLQTPKEEQKLTFTVTPQLENLYNADTSSITQTQPEEAAAALSLDGVCKTEDYNDVCKTEDCNDYHSKNNDRYLHIDTSHIGTRS